MMAIKRGLAAAIIVCVFALSLSVEVFAEQDSGTFLVVTMKDGSSEVFSVPVDSDKVESAAFAFPDAGLHELEGKHNLVAIINDVPITTGDFYGEISDLVGRQVLSYIIDETLVRQSAKRSGIAVTQAEIDRELEIYREAAGENFNAFLTQYGMTEADFRRTLEMSLLVFKVSTEDVQVSDADIAEYYESHKADYTIPEKVRASHILVETEQDAEEIIELLAEGADFEGLARERSLDTYSAEVGGDLGYFPRGAMVVEFEQAAFSMAVGETSGIVESQFGYHILQVTDRAEAETVPLENVSEGIERLIMSEYALDFKELVAELRRDSTIVVFDPRFADLGTTTLP
jgi:foldase protein PrsA